MNYKKCFFTNFDSKIYGFKKTLSFKLFIIVLFFKSTYASGINNEEYTCITKTYQVN